MALPSLVKTWQFDVNHRGGVDSVNLEDHQRHAFAIKEAMTNFALKPMLVSRSSNASVADGTDNWSTYTDVVWSTGNHSWIVLKSQGTVPYEICMAFDDATPQDSSYIGFSMSGGFNAGAGGTDGSISARPTALDEMAVHVANWDWAGNQTTFNSQIHGLMSTDGNTMMMIAFINNVPQAVWRFDLLQDPTTGYVNGMHVWMKFSSTIGSVMTFTQSSSTGNKWSWDDGGGAQFLTAHLSFEAIGSTEVGAPVDFTQPNTWSGKWPFYPIGVWTEGAKRGKAGMITDMWWGSASAGEGSMYPDTGTPNQFAQVGKLIIPWDSTNPLLTS